jgi:hypothetical protein
MNVATAQVLTGVQQRCPAATGISKAFPLGVVVLAGDDGEVASQQLEEYERRRPVAVLRPFIAWYGGYRQAGVQPGVHRGLPSPYLTFIVTFDEPLTMAMHVNPDQSPGQYETLIGGLRSPPALIAHEGSQSGIQLSLHPFGARALFGLPAGELAGIDLHAVDVMGPIAAELQGSSSRGRNLGGAVRSPRPSAVGARKSRVTTRTRARLRLEADAVHRRSTQYGQTC